MFENVKHSWKPWFQCSLVLVLSAQAAPAQHPPPDLAVCEDTRVSLGETKQQVRTSLSVCCRFKNKQFDQKEYPNQIVFEANREGVTCSGFLLFDSSEKLAFAE